MPAKRKRKTSADKRRRRRPHASRAARARALAAAPPAPPPPEPGTIPGAPTAKHPPPPELVAIADELAKVTDPLQGNALAHKALLASMKDVLLDESLTPTARRKELRTIAAAAKELLPDSRRWEVDQLIKQDRAEVEAKARARRGAPLEPVPLEPVPPVDFGGEVETPPESSSSSAPEASAGG